METISVVGESIPVLKGLNQPYSPSWVDRLNDWVNRLHLPSWVFYLCLWLLLILIETGSKWLDGVEPFGKVGWIYVLYTFYGVYFLAAIHYLDTWAKTAFITFRPVLAVGEVEESLLFYQLTTMPVRMVRLLSATTLVSLIVLIQPLIMPLWEAMGFFHTSIASTLVDLGLFYFNALIVVVFVYHTLHQLRWVSRVHKTATYINLFQLRPLYSLSGLTARTAGILLIVGFIIGQQSGTHGVFTANPYALRMSELFTLLTIGIYSLLAMAVFFLPLLGLHQLLLHEKERLQAEADSRLQAHIQELHRRIDAHQLQDADAINYHLTSLALERDVLARLPTWPWQPGTLNLILSAVLLPIILWFIQQLLERWVGL
jgi:hypothetical protein